MVAVLCWQTLHFNCSPVTYIIIGCQLTGTPPPLVSVATDELTIAHRLVVLVYPAVAGLVVAELAAGSPDRE